MEQLEELRRKDLIRQLDCGGFVRYRLDVKTGTTKQDLRPWEEIVREMLLHVLESVYPNILSVKDLIRIDFAEESVVMEQLEELRGKDLIRKLDSGGFVRHLLDVKTRTTKQDLRPREEIVREMFATCTRISFIPTFCQLKILSG
ncbi:uncharacterized protein LOC132737529 [Ruditapes philippinarum]|uniref:uncharacterized protein LOC132737529 n=1 Tax=Ruditapes philippinarum TaxID=129788 RepID=UPI00295B566D|nr:uncharacterized protein LOC132737529 [Ruditapes philippinarum]